MAISEAEKIRRAEEIYYKRRYNQNYRGYEEPKKKKGFLKWLLGKILYIGLIVACVYGYNNKDYLMSEQFKKDFNTFINTPIDINEIIKNIYTNDEQTVEKEEKSEAEENKTIDINNIEESNQEIMLVNSIPIGVVKTAYIKTEAKEENTKDKNEKNSKKEETVEEYIKRICKFKRPVSGNVSSRYGKRTSKYKNVSKNHTGIDVAASYGSYITSAIDGKVIEVSSEGNYGKHLKIQSSKDNNIITLYAHCSKILVKKGENVKRGQKIAKVGNTGNTTGAHLHFEIRYKNQYINPEKILEF